MCSGQKERCITDSDPNECGAEVGDVYYSLVLVGISDDEGKMGHMSVWIRLSCSVI